MLDRAAWHELKMTVDGADFKAYMNGEPALDTRSAASRGPAATAPRRIQTLYPANNPVLRPPVAGQVGLWSKTDSTSYFKDFVVSHEVRRRG